MSTQAIQNPAIAPIVSVQPVKLTEPSAPETSFSHVLSREISNRTETSNKNDASPKDNNSASTPSTAPTTAPSSIKSAEKSTDKSISAEDTETETTDESTVTNTPTPSEILALVANIGQMTATKIDPPPVDSDALEKTSLKTDRTLTGISGLTQADSNSLAMMIPTKKDEKLNVEADSTSIDTIVQAAAEQITLAKATSKQAPLTDTANMQDNAEQASLLESQFAKVLQKKSANTSKVESTSTNVTPTSAEPSVASTSPAVEQKPVTGTPINQEKSFTSNSDSAKISATNTDEKASIKDNKIEGATGQSTTSSEIKSEAKFVVTAKEQGESQPILDQNSGPKIQAASVPAANIPVEEMATAITENSRASVIDVAPSLSKEMQAPPSPTLASAQQVAFSSAQIVQGNANDKLTPRVGSPAWDQALGQKIVWMVGGAQQSASLTLNPPDLGPLQIVLNVSNSQATAAFTASQPEVRQALETALPKLREILNDAGIQLGQATVSTGTPNHQNHTNDQSQKFSSPFTPFTEANDVKTPVTRTRTSTEGQGLIDTFA